MQTGAPTVAEVETKQSKLMHWVMVTIALVSLLVSNGMVLTGLTAFDSAMLAEFPEWTRGDLKMRGLITLVCTGLLAPFIGILIDRIGVKLLMMVGSIVLGVAYFFYGMIENIQHMYLIHAVFSIVLVACGLNVAVILVSNWFAKLRGTAIGIAVMGTSLGGALLAPLFGGWIADGMHWREAFQLAAVIPAVLFLLAALIVRNKPSDLKLLPFGFEANDENAHTDLSVHGLAYKEALKTKSFWSIAIIAMFTFYTLLGLQANLILHLQDLGFDIQSAAAGLAMLFTPALIGKFAFGLIADRIKGKRILYANLTLMLFGLVALLFTDKSLVLFAVAVIGFAWGGFYTLLQLNAVNNFGLKASGKLLGTITVLDAFGGGLGIFLTGKMFDIYGNYNAAFIVFIVLVTISIGLISFIKKHVD